MGWTGTYPTKLAACEPTFNNGKRWTNMRGGESWVDMDSVRMTASGGWAIGHSTDETGKQFSYIVFVLVERRGDGFYEKGMSEMEGPYYHDCPVELINRCPDPCKHDSTAFRARCAAYRTEKIVNKSKRQSVGIGTILALPDGFKPNRLTVCQITGRKVFGITDSGVRYRITPKIIDLAQISGSALAELSAA